jgi:uncharacterized protein YbbK (DUF523 family)
MKRYSKKGLEKRKAERECLSEFFIRHVNKIKTEKLHCANCGEKLKADVSEVAHRLPKSTFKSIQCDDDNVIYLGGRFSSCGCHNLYDGTNEQLQSLNIFSAEKEIVKELLEKVTEQINYKIYEKWQL